MTFEHFKEAMGTASDLSNLAGAIQRNTQTQLLREQNSLLRAQEAEQQRLAALPKCPECMQPVEYKSRVCSRCMVAVFWLDIVELENLDDSSSPKADIGLWLVSKPLLESALTQNFQRLQTQSAQIRTAFQNHVRRVAEVLEKLQGFQNDLLQSFSSFDEGKTACDIIDFHHGRLRSLQDTIKKMGEEKFGRGCVTIIVLPFSFFVYSAVFSIFWISLFGWRDPISLSKGAAVQVTSFVLGVMIYFYVYPFSGKIKDTEKTMKESNDEIERCKKSGKYQLHKLQVELHRMLDSWFKRQHDFEVIRESFESVIQSHSTLMMRLDSGAKFSGSHLQLDNCVANINTKYSRDLLFKDAEWFRQTFEHLAENTGLKNLVPKAQPSRSKPANTRKGKVPHQYWIKRGEKIHGPFDAARVLNQSQKNKFKTGDRLGNFQDGPWALLSSEHLAKMQSGTDVVIS